MTLNGSLGTDSRASTHWILLLLFAGSGCSALIYEIVWYQLLEFSIGATAVSLAVLLATFMGGLCLGSLALPRIAAARRADPLRVYAALEMGIALCGILVRLAMPLASRVYVAAFGHGLPAVLLRALVCAACLLVPTMLMGASLPAVSRSLAASPRGARWAGLWYGANTAGAVFGCLLAGFYLLRLFDMAVATYVAVAINLAVAAVGYALSLAPGAPGASDESAAAPQPQRRVVLATPPSGAWTIYAAIAISGACALGAEVVWTRLLGLILGPTVYTFSVVLAVFLVGLALGSGAGSLLSTEVNPATALGLSQLALAAGIAWTAFMLAKSLPYWPINPKLLVSPWMTFQVDIVRVAWAVLPPALLWGASFPLAIAAVGAGSAVNTGAAANGADAHGDPAGTDASASRQTSDLAAPVARVYAANTAGAILGALGAALALIPRLGTGRAQQELIVLATLAAVIVLVPRLPAAAGKRTRAGARVAPQRALALAAGVALALLLAAAVPAVAPRVIAFGRLVTTSNADAEVLYSGEGLNSSIAITRFEHTVTFHVAGKIEASTNSYDMRMQRMLADLPAMLHPDPRSVLIVGFGAGVTAGSFVPNPDVQHIQIAEIEPLIPPASTRFFREQNFGVLEDPRTRVTYDDARSFLLTTPQKFDIITSDPIHPWVKGSASLYTREYFELARRHLNPGGIVAQWVPMYETDVDSVRSEIATFFEAFPDGTIWANASEDQGFDLVLLGQAQPAPVDVDALEARLEDPRYRGVQQSLAEVGLETAVKLLGTYAGRAQDLRPWLAGAQINRDGNLRLQYLAGFAVNAGVERRIYHQILGYCDFPSGFFVGSRALLDPLANIFE